MEEVRHDVRSANLGSLLSGCTSIPAVSSIADTINPNYATLRETPGGARSGLNRGSLYIPCSPSPSLSKSEKKRGFVPFPAVVMVGALPIDCLSKEEAWFYEEVHGSQVGYQRGRSLQGGEEKGRGGSADESTGGVRPLRPNANRVKRLRVCSLKEPQQQDCVKRVVLTLMVRH